MSWIWHNNKIYQLRQICSHCQEEFAGELTEALCEACQYVLGLSASEQDFYLAYLEEDAQATYLDWKGGNWRITWP